MSYARSNVRIDEELTARINAPGMVGETAWDDLQIIHRLVVRLGGDVTLTEGEIRGDVGGCIESRHEKLEGGGIRITSRVQPDES